MLGYYESSAFDRTIKKTVSESKVKKDPINLPDLVAKQAFANPVDSDQEKVFLQAWIGLDTFKGMTVEDILEEVIKLDALLKRSEGFQVRNHRNRLITYSAETAPNHPAALLSIIWPVGVMVETSEGFWKLVQHSWKAIAGAESIDIEFPKRIVILKSNHTAPTKTSYIPVP